MAKLLVIGGSGFFGKSILDSYLVGVLQGYGVSQLALVSRRASALRAYSRVQRAEGLDLIDSDVRALGSLLESDIVIHAACSSDARRYQSDPAGEHSVIVDGTARVLKLADQSERPVQLIYVSSGAVYGPQPGDLPRLDEEAAFAIEPDATKLVYAEAKRSAEYLVRSAASSRGIRCAIARCFAFVGPALPLDQHFAIGNFLGDALKGNAITVTSTQHVVRSYMFTDDLVDWLLTIAGHSSSECPIYNVGSDEAVSIRAVAGMIGEIAGVKVILPTLDVSAAPHRYVPSTNRVRRDLGVTMKFGLRNAIVETMLRRLEMSSGRARTIASRIQASGL